MSKMELEVKKENVTEKMENEAISRKDFLKKGMLGIFGVALASKMLVSTDASARDNLSMGGGGIHVGTKAPSSKNKLWIDTGKSGRGVVKYWDGIKWSATASVWDE